MTDETTHPPGAEPARRAHRCGHRTRRWVLAGIALPAAGLAAGLLASREAGAGRNPRVIRTFPAAGVARVVLRAAEADDAEVVTNPDADAVEVSGEPAGGAPGYHSPDPGWRETPARDWGLDFAAARHGGVLVVSTVSEIHYIHHGYRLLAVRVRVPPGVEVARERRELTGDGTPDLRPPGS